MLELLIKVSPSLEDLDLNCKILLFEALKCKQLFVLHSEIELTTEILLKEHSICGAFYVLKVLVSSANISTLEN